MRTLRLAILAILAVVCASAWAKELPGGDPGTNNLPPAGAILDLAGTPIPGGGNTIYQKYTTTFVATGASTAITFAFREDPAFIYFSNPSVTDQTLGSGNLLTNADFAGGTFTSNGNGLTPIGWIYANVYGATFGGELQSNCGAGPSGQFGVGFCWYDGAVQAYDALTQSIATTPGHQYQITFWIADDSGCQTFNGPISPCNFSQLSTNGDSSDTGGNGIDVLAYTGAALPAPAALQVELATLNSPPSQAMGALATATNTDGSSDNMQDAAQKVGFDHFNWVQIIKSDLQLAACAANSALPGCSSDFTITGSVPSLPTVDPPLGGYAYELCTKGVTTCQTLCMSTPICQMSFPAQDFWSMYWDEYFAVVDATDGNEYYYPGTPEYLSKYRAASTLATIGSGSVSAASALSFAFSDAAGSNFTVPGTTSTTESIQFVTALVGVTGSCNLLVSSNCGFLIIPGSIFKWTSTGGAVTFAANPGGSLTHRDPTPESTSMRMGKHAVDSPTSVADLTGSQLASSLISVDEFYQFTGLTPTSLAAMGGGISIFSASLVPTEAAALAAVTAGLTAIPPTNASVTASGLAYSRVTQTFKGTITVTNVGGSSITGPLQVLLDNLPTSVSVTNASGKLASVPYLTVSVTSLAPGQSATATVQLKNPSNTTINLTPSVYSGTVQ